MKRKLPPYCFSRFKKTNIFFCPPDESLTASNPVQQLQPLDDRESCARAWGSGPLETQDCDIAFVCGVCRLPER